MLHRISLDNNKKLFKSGFSLLEVIFAMVFVSILLAPLPGLINSSSKNLKNADNIDYSSVHILISDLEFDTSLATSTSLTNTGIIVNRIDGCSVAYNYDQNLKSIKKTYNCPVGVDGKIRILNIGNIDIFNITINGNEFLLDIKKTSEKYTHEFIIRNN